MLLQRILTALLLAPIAIALIVLLPTGGIALVVSLLLLAAWWEWCQLTGITNVRLRIAIAALCAIGFAVFWCYRGDVLWLSLSALGVLWWLVVCFWLRRFAYAAARTRENQAIKLAAGALTIFPAWGALLWIHTLGELADSWWPPARGHWWALLALVIVWAADIGAYFSGTWFGKRKLARSISPGKTWEGVYGAFLTAAIAAGVGGWLLGVHGVHLFGLALLGVFTVSASIIGDLFESLLKRHANIKDSGTLFPGHGGLLDRLDSVFAAMPVFAFGMYLLGL